MFFTAQTKKEENQLNEIIILLFLLNSRVNSTKRNIHIERYLWIVPLLTKSVGIFLLVLIAFFLCNSISRANCCIAGKHLLLYIRIVFGFFVNVIHVTHGYIFVFISHESSYLSLKCIYIFNESAFS